MHVVTISAHIKPASARKDKPSPLKIAHAEVALCARTPGSVHGQSLEELHLFGFADIYKWGGSSSQFCLVLWDQHTQATFELSVVTAQVGALLLIA